MNNDQKINYRLKEWHEDLSELKIHGNLFTWHKLQILELNAMHKDNLLTTDEMPVLRKLAIDRYCALAGIPLSHYAASTHYSFPKSLA